MDSDSGSFVGSSSGSFFASSTASNSNCSVKSRAGTSSSSSSNHFQEQGLSNYFQKMNERNKLLNSKIIEINIGIEPIGPKIGHFLTNNIFVNHRRLFMPSHLGGGTFCHHLSCLFKLENSETLILEYGGYYGKEPSYQNCVHYWRKRWLKIL